jgi:uncharacterized protein YeeX (DUF496 family)
MKITKSQLKRVIKEEMEKEIREAHWTEPDPDGDPEENEAKQVLLKTLSTLIKNEWSHEEIMDYVDSVVRDLETGTVPGHEDTLPAGYGPGPW